MTVTDLTRVFDNASRLNIDYRHFDANNIEPRFEFGFGLSYTSFKYSNMQVTEIESSFAEAQTKNWEASKPSPNGEGSSAALWCVFIARSSGGKGTGNDRISLLSYLGFMYLVTVSPSRLPMRERSAVPRYVSSSIEDVVCVSSVDDNSPQSTPDPPSVCEPSQFRRRAPCGPEGLHGRDTRSGRQSAGHNYAL